MKTEIEVQVRLAEPNDYPAICQVGRLSFGAQFGLKHLGDAGVLVAGLGRLVTGYAIYSDGWVPGCRTILSMATHPEWRRSGVATQVIEVLQAVTAIDGIPLRAISIPINEPWIAFLQSVGFRLVEDRDAGLIFDWGF